MSDTCSKALDVLVRVEVKGDTPCWERIISFANSRRQKGLTPPRSLAQCDGREGKGTRDSVKTKGNSLVPCSVGNRYICLRSTTVVQVHRKHQVVGSNPIGGSGGGVLVAV